MLENDEHLSWGSSGKDNISGNYNTYVGTFAGLAATGSNNTFVGWLAGD